MEFKPIAISPEEAFRKIGVSRALGYKLIKNGSIPSIRLSERRLLIPVTALEKMFEVNGEGSNELNCRY
jgi:predicted site-specific integrase-resolvase